MPPAPNNTVKEWVALLGFVTTALRVFAIVTILVLDAGIVVRLYRHQDVFLQLFLLLVATAVLLAARTLAYALFTLLVYGGKAVAWLVGRGE